MRRVHFDVTDSTNTQARRMAIEYPGECVLVSAGEQQAGCGGRGRAWHSPRGGAWMSLAWPMQKAPGAYAAASLVAALVTLRAVRDVAPECADRLQIKWPNDLLLDGCKVAGILCEQFMGGGGSARPVLVIGVGINVDFDPADLGADLRHPATTLRTATGRSVAVDAVVDAVSQRLVDSLADFEAEGLSESVLHERRADLAYTGSVRSFDFAGRTTTGRVTGIDPSGRLLLMCEAREIAFDAGEYLAAAPAAAP